MKRKLPYLLPLLLVFASGCLTDKNNAPTPANAPEGTFAGKFKFTHIHAQTGAVDSATANIQLKMETATGFQVTGDTSTVHAGSYGSYIVSTPYSNVDFIDHTYPTTGVPAKNHLNGVYTYSYDGTTLQLVAYGAFDTLSYYYNLKKIGN
ncbi:MAG TPA: hypothetical protein VIM16_14770 [Mucilaginibacter sp.]|jgi:hypothetical protein